MVDPILFIFGFLALVVIFPLSPFKWSLLAYLILVHINLVDNSFTSATSIGVENAIKVIVLPTILLVRTRFLGFRIVRYNLAFWLWIIFGIYITVATIWSPLKLPAIKQIGFFYAYTVIWLVFVYAFKMDRKETYKIVARSFIAAFILAIIQTYLLVNAPNNFGGIDDRFTSFTASQNFALYLALLLIILIPVKPKHINGNLSKIILISLILLSIVLNASRTNLVSLLIILLLVAVFWGTSKQKFGQIAFVTGLLSSMILLVFTLLLLLSTFYKSEFTTFIQSNRSLQLLGVLDDNFTLNDIGTARFRTNIYATLLDQIEQKPLSEVLFGSGTSSTGELITQGIFNYRGYNESTVDANRLAHNEFLRALYEWGVFGLAIFVLFFIAVFSGTLNLARKRKIFKFYVSSTSLIVIFLFLMLENILAGSGGPGGIIIAILFADLAASSTIHYYLPSKMEIQRV
ncbi:O-antigen ligase family protein [Candidatus Leptofilum sp.]|uniref:O-antigen ligase family protein n=1 Tax=Candidatus Leptofilum sp. TaxID=3241576 RepID=UPI003B59D0E5